MNDNDLLECIQIYKTSTSSEVKKSIVEEIRHIDDTQLKYLLHYGDKYDWWIESEILIALGYPHVKPVIEKIFEWLQDMAWSPGPKIWAFIIN